MASMIEICNLALGFLGEPPVADLNEQRPAARYCKLYLRPALEALLRDHPWNFAQDRERLTSIDVPDGWAGQYKHAYVMPAQCVRLHHLVTAGGCRVRCFALTDHGGRTLVLTSLENAVAEFTRLIDDANHYDALFSQVFARKLQCLLVKPLLKSSPSAVQEAETLYQRAMEEARVQDAREGRSFQDDGSLWYGGHDYWGDTVERECGR